MSLPVLSVLSALSLLAAPARARAQDLDQPAAAPTTPAEAAAPPPAPVLTRAPALKAEVAPVYPPEAFAAGLSADVTMTVDIDAAGHVTDARVVGEPVGHGFDEAALAAARAMEFTPAEIDGHAAAIRIAYVMHFRPVVAPPPPPPPPSPTPAPRPPIPVAPPRVILRGRIREKGTRDPIAGATVLLMNRAPTTTTTTPPPTTPSTSTSPAPALQSPTAAKEVAASDTDGRFEVSLAADVVAAAIAGAQTVRVVVTESAHEACVRDLTAAELASATPTAWTCVAAPTTDAFETRVRAPRSTSDVARRTLTQPELTTVPGTYGDPLRVIQNLPGVARAPYGLGLLIVRGAPPTDTGVWVSGQAIPQLYHFLVGPSVIAPHLIERVDFFPGGFGARYGRFSGGAVDVILKEGPAEHLHGGVDVSVLDVSAYAEGPVRAGTTATIAVRRSTVDAILPHVIPRRQGSTFITAVPVYWDYQARVVQELGGGARAGLLAFGSDDALEVVTQDPEAGNFSLNSHASFHRVVGFWSTTAGGWTSRLAPGYGNGEESFTLGGAYGFIRYQRAYLREDLSRPIGRHFDLRVGFDGLLSYDTASFQSFFPREGRTFGTTAQELEEANRRLVDWAPAAFVEGDWRPSSRWPELRIVPGVRFDDYHVIGVQRTSLDPRLTVRLPLAAGATTLKAGAGLYHQLPVPQFLDQEFGNPNLALIWSEQYHAGVERALTPTVRLDATAYYLRRHDLPVPSPERFSSIGRGRGWGLELWLKHEVTAHFFGWLAYTLSWSEQTGSSAEEMLSGTASSINVPGDNKTYHPSPYDQRHNLIAVASYRRGAWQFGGRYRLVSGRPTSTVTGGFNDTDFGGYTPQVASMSGRLPTFNQLDVRVERTFTFDAWTLGAYLDVQNIFNAENPESYVYDYRFQQRAPVRGLPILPVIGLRGRF